MRLGVAAAKKVFSRFFLLTFLSEGALPFLSVLTVLLPSPPSCVPTLVQPGFTARPTFLMMPYDRITGALVLGATVFGAFHLTRVVVTMFKQGIAVNGHPSERQ